MGTAGIRKKMRATCGRSWLNTQQQAPLTPPTARRCAAADSSTDPGNQGRGPCPDPRATEESSRQVVSLGMQTSHDRHREVQ